MKKFIVIGLTLSFVLIICHISFGIDPPDIEWYENYGTSVKEVFISVEQTPDGGYIMGGSKSDDYWIFKTDDNGTTILVNNTYPQPSSSAQEHTYELKQTHDGGYILVGAAYNGSNGYVLKTDSDGIEEWFQEIDRSGYDVAKGVCQTDDGGYAVTGEFGYKDAFLVKYDANGYEVWAEPKTYGAGGDDEGYQVLQTSDGGYMIAGITTSYGAGGFDGWLIKTDSSGNELWHRTFGGSGDDRIFSMQQTNDGGYILAGYSSSFGGGFDFYVIKTDSSATKEWSQTFGRSGDDRGTEVKQTKDGGYIVVGTTNYYMDGWVLKLDAGGNEEWNKVIGGGGQDEFNSVFQTLDGGYILAGNTGSFGSDRFDGYLVKLAPEKIYSSCVGFDPPMEKDAVKVKKNRVLPIKAELRDKTGGPLTDLDITALPVIQVLFDSGSGEAVDVTDDALPAGMGTEGNQLEWDGEKWHYNLETKNYTAPGTYTITVVSGDDSEYVIDPTCTAVFVIETK